MVWGERRKAFGAPIEPMIVIAVIGVLAALAIPAFLAARVTFFDWTCVRNMQQMASGGGGGDPECPHAGGLYAWAGGVLACPQVESPLPSRPRYVRQGEALTLQQELPTYEQPSVRTLLLDQSGGVYATRRTDGSVLIERRASFVRAKVLVPVVWLILFGVIVMQSWFSWQQGGFPGESSGERFKRLRHVANTALGCSLPALAVAVGWTYAAAREEVITLEPGGAVSVQVAHYGFEHGEPERIAKPLLLIPIRATNDPQGRTQVGVLVEEDGAVAWHGLFELPFAHTGVLEGIATLGKVVAPTDRGGK